MSVPAFVMKIFEPLTTHEPSRSSARVRVAPGVRARAGLGQPERGELPARGEVGQPLALLLLVAEEQDRHRPERGVRGHRDRDGGVDPRQLLDRDRVRERVGAGAAVLLRDRDAHQPELGHLGDELVREALLAVELGGERRDALARRTRARCAGPARARRTGRSSRAEGRGELDDQPDAVAGAARLGEVVVRRPGKKAGRRCPGAPTALRRRTP